MRACRGTIDRSSADVAGRPAGVRAAPDGPLSTPGCAGMRSTCVSLPEVYHRPDDRALMQIKFRVSPACDSRERVWSPEANAKVCVRLLATDLSYRPFGGNSGPILRSFDLDQSRKPFVGRYFANRHARGIGNNEPSVQLPSDSRSRDQAACRGALDNDSAENRAHRRIEV